PGHQRMELGRRNHARQSGVQLVPRHRLWPRRRLHAGGSHAGGAMSGYAASETERQLAGLIRIGVISALDDAGARVRVQCGGLTTDWLPWLTMRAGADRSWWAPEPGEQVVVLSPNGDTAQGVVLPALYSDALPPPANARTVHRTTYADGSVVEYDRAAHQLTVNVGSGQVVVVCNTATVQAAESVTLDTPQTVCTGNLAVTGVMNVMGTG